MSISPVPRKEELPKYQACDITLSFNDQAQLTAVDAPEMLSRLSLIEHLAVATQFVAQTAAKEGE